MRTFRRLSSLFVLLVLLTAPTAPLATANSTASQIQQDIKRLLQTDKLSVRDVEILTRTTLPDVYEHYDFKPYWNSPHKVSELMELIRNSTDHGL